MFNFIEDLSVQVFRHTKSSPWKYSDLDHYQRQLAAQVSLGTQRGAILLSELAPVITLGRRTPETDLTLSLEELQRLGIEVYRTDRGGLATYHGPGQWVLFPVTRLEDLTGDRRGVRKGVQTLLEIALEVATEFHAKAEIREGCELGVWTPRGKLASVGIQVHQGVLLHGLALNCFRTPQSFTGLRPCGLDKALDYVFEAPSEAQFARLGERLLQSTLARFRKPNSSQGFGLTEALPEAIRINVG